MLCDVAVSKHYTFNYKLNFNQGTNSEPCTQPAILQNTCYMKVGFHALHFHRSTKKKKEKMSVGNFKKSIMNKGLTILANHKTNERIVVFLNPTENNIQKIVNEKFGGSWVKVGELCLGDMLKFTSDDIYLGFDNREDDNYCQGALIKK